MGKTVACAFGFALIIVGCQFFTSNRYSQVQTNELSANPMVKELLADAPPPPKGFAAPLDYVKSFTNGADIEKAYRSGKMSKGEAMLALSINKISPNDKSPMDTYGKVIDQDGKPVVGAKVRGWLEFEERDIDEEHDVKTDEQGRFQFLGLRGKGLGISPEKAGYGFNTEIRFSANAKRPDKYLPDPQNPLIFRMWKLRGGEPMSYAQVLSFVKSDGNFKHFNLYKYMNNPTWSDREDTTGELMVKVTRGITFTTNGVQMFPWTATLTITNGGLLAFNDPYPYVAPAEGYQTFVTLEGPTNFVENPTNLESWGNGLRRGFYFKSKNGQIYGRMVIRMSAGRNYASFDADIYANVTGSHNLEFDGKHRIDYWQNRKDWPNIWPPEENH